MPNDLTKYYQARPKMRIGDAILFQGHGGVSGPIEAISGPATHVALVARSYDFMTDSDVIVIQSTLDIRVNPPCVMDGAQLSSLAAMVAGYGDQASAIWCPLDGISRNFFNYRSFNQWLNRVVGNVGYDALGLAEYAVHKFFTFTSVPENPREMFCSALGENGYEAAVIIPNNINYRTISPTAFAQQKLFAPAVDILRHFEVPDYSTKDVRNV
jgi:hypothetical protein